MALTKVAGLLDIRKAILLNAGRWFQSRTPSCFDWGSADFKPAVSERRPIFIQPRFSGCTLHVTSTSYSLRP